MALVLTWLSGLDYARVAPGLLRGRPVSPQLDSTVGWFANPLGLVFLGAPVEVLADPELPPGAAVSPRPTVAGKQLLHRRDDHGAFLWARLRPDLDLHRTSLTGSSSPSRIDAPSATPQRRHGGTRLGLKRGSKSPFQNDASPSGCDGRCVARTQGARVSGGYGCDRGRRPRGAQRSLAAQGFVLKGALKTEAPADDTNGGMSRLLALAVCCSVLLAPSALAGRVGDPGQPRRASGAAPASWALADIRYVVAHGLMAKSVAGFRASDPLTQGELATLVAGLTTQPARATADPSAQVTVAQLDARLVRMIELSDAAATFTSGARAAGLSVPARFGNETVARLLGLRTNHPARQDDLELLPGDPVTRAETAYSVAKVLRFGGWEQQYVENAAATFALPTLGAWQKRVLNTAVRFIGFPYVWGGTSEKAEAPFGVHAHGGFDCSGFVWRVYKLQPYPGGAALSSVIKGRTTYQMSGEVPRAKRITFSKLSPGDVLFFGSAGPRSKPNQVGHAGIYLGGGWMIHSSGQGVAVAPMSGWYRQQFAWGRRPLTEAGLLPGI